MQHLKNFNWKKFLLQGVLPCLLAVAVGFISRYQLELSDGVTESFLQLQWPLYAPLNALPAARTPRAFQPARLGAPLTSCACTNTIARIGR